MQFPCVVCGESANLKVNDQWYCAKHWESGMSHEQPTKPANPPAAESSAESDHERRNIAMAKFLQRWVNNNAEAAITGLPADMTVRLDTTMTGVRFVPSR